MPPFKVTISYIIANIIRYAPAFVSFQLLTAECWLLKASSKSSPYPSFKANDELE
jgi:hypothetical protein